MELAYIAVFGWIAVLYALWEAHVDAQTIEGDGTINHTERFISRGLLGLAAATAFALAPSTGDQSFIAKVLMLWVAFGGLFSTVFRSKLNGHRDLDVWYMSYSNNYDTLWLWLANRVSVSVFMATGRVWDSAKLAGWAATAVELAISTTLLAMLLG